jgi:putative Ca2+/H+ antiporter (TMEM165/GDT1 family)
VANRHLKPVLGSRPLLAIREARREQRREAREEALAAAEALAHPRRVVVTAFIVIFLAEWGDLTQILTANLAAHYHSPLSVGLGAVLALWAVAAIAVLGGQSVLRFVKITTVRYATAVVLIGLAAYAASTAM